MQVRSPVGTFPVRIKSVGADRDGMRLRTTMGAWKSEIVLDSEDLPLAAWGVAVLIAVYALGRVTASRGRG